MKSRLTWLPILLVLAGCNNDQLTNGPAFRSQSDTYTQVAVDGKADILFVINDTDNTMVVKATRMGNSAAAFMNYLTTKAVDFHIAVTSMDMATPCGSSPVGTSGCFNGSPLVISNQTTNLLPAFQANLQVGFQGDHAEMGLDASVAAVTAPLTSGADGGFLRPDARLFIVYLSDEDDQSNGTTDSYLSALVGAKGGLAGLLVVSAIVGPVPEGCDGGSGNSSDPTSAGADPGFAYASLVQRSNGLFESVCDPQYSTFLDNLGYHAGASQAQFFLTQTPSDPSTIQVTVNGAPAPSSSWTYDPVTNSITFVAGSVPAAGAVVVITYQVLA